ncbi:MAG: trehalose permease IIC protein, partial [Enterobacterales bacterium]|nr:trehalose permease IIC protein [Enterobacterales bacterium]
IQPKFWGIYAVAMVVAIVVPLALTILIYKRKQKRGELPV